METTKSRDIKDIVGFDERREEIKNQVKKSNERLLHSVKKIKSFDLKPIKNSLIKPSWQSDLEAVGDMRQKFLPKMTSKLLNATILRKSGFLKRMILSTAASLTVKKALAKKRTNPKPVIQAPIDRPQKQVVTQKQPQPEKQPEQQSGKKVKLTFKGIFAVLKSAFDGLIDHKITKMSGSLAYYTVFSMGPLLVVIISLFSIFYEKEVAQGKIFDQLKGFLGSETALQMQGLISSAAIGDKGTIAFIIGIITLLVGATSIFADIQDSINTIWGIKPKPKRGWLKLLQNRFLSFSVIVSLGFLLVVTLAVTAVLDGFSERLQARFEGVSVLVFYILNLVITFGVITTIFGVIFKVLPDADIKWKDVVSGAAVTGILFMLGKFGISFYISKTNTGGTYGAAGSLVILLLWTYYSSIILYFGAEFTKSYALAYGSEIHPNHYAVGIKEVETELENSSLQQTQAK
ncbi:YihY/virulence factor BrkB family protein [Pedobacter sp. N23S346]|uniref:YihY/virulence factor BrkB family protein n=1 Tax=Pedobacter sp. N23S346 TaxID=3402750 RepID=UPI003AD320EA